MTTEQDNTLNQLIDLSDSQISQEMEPVKPVVHNLLDMDFTTQDDHVQLTSDDTQKKPEAHQSDPLESQVNKEPKLEKPNHSQIDDLSSVTEEEDTDRNENVDIESADKETTDTHKEDKQRKDSMQSEETDHTQKDALENTAEDEFDDVQEKELGSFDNIKNEEPKEEQKDDFDEFESTRNEEFSSLNDLQENDFEEFDDHQDTQKNDFEEFDENTQENDFDNNQVNIDKELGDFDETQKDEFDDFNDKDEFGFDKPKDGFSDGQNDDFDDFGEFDDNGFVDADNQNDDDFGDFDDFEQETKEVPPPRTPTEADVYVDMLNNDPDQLPDFIHAYLNRIWHKDQDWSVSSPIELNENKHDILVTPCSQDLWNKLSHETAFYNPITGAVGQFQWIRSETNKAYLHALGVTLNYDDKSKIPSKKPLRQSADIKRVSSPPSPSSNPASPRLQTPPRPASVSPNTNNGLRVMTDKMDEGTREAKKEADQEMELDIDIARAYCELTEETIRIFPDVKLNAMVIELSRLQRQAADYLDHLLDQREQLKMDSETYNDLISCIVGHAQRLHVNSKDASPAMVSKKKKANSGTFTNIMRRKTTTTNVQSASMSGGVVGMKKQTPQPAPSNNTNNSRRSM